MSCRTVSAELISDVKNYLDITWNDNATDTKICGIIDSGTRYLSAKCGRHLDFENDSLANILLKDYCRYARDAALDVFENNYRSLILALQTERQVEDYVAFSE